jgi:hypothetical protein
MLNKVLDKYYKRPVLYDLLISIIVVLGVNFLQKEDYISLNFDSNSNDISTIGLTISGFILTLLSILLTLKSRSILSNENNYKNNFEVFLGSSLYTKSIKILKKGVIILIFISLISLTIGALMKNLYKDYGLYINIVCLIFISLTFLRCFHILNLIFDMQNKQAE